MALHHYPHLWPLIAAMAVPIVAYTLVCFAITGWGEWMERHHHRIGHADED